MVCEEVERAMKELGAHLSAYVLMPDHIHLLVFLPDKGMLHTFNKLWRGRSARRIIDLLKEHNAVEWLDKMARHANGKAQYAVWKEQVRALGLSDKKKLYAKIDYIHANPVERKLVVHPGDWQFSSWRLYENEEVGVLPVQPPVL